MTIQCKHCKKIYNIKEDRVRKFGSHVKFPCPACKGLVEINLGKPRISADLQQQLNYVQKDNSQSLKQQIVASIEDLPPMPQVVRKARSMITDLNCSFVDLAKVIETDQAIAAKVLKIANSPFYGMRGQVTSLQHASVVLGLRTLNELLSLACTAELLSSTFYGYGMSSGALWRHSLAVAECAREIAAERNPATQEDAFAAGLIHDCGKIILDKYIFQRRTEFQKCMRMEGLSSLQAEKQILGFDHAEIASEVCEKWDVPRRLATVIRYHHAPRTLENDVLASIVHAADTIVLMSGLGVGIDGMKYKLDEATIAELDLNREKVGMLMAKATEYVNSTVSAFH